MSFQDIEKRILDKMAELEDLYHRGLVSKWDYIREYTELEEDLNKWYSN